VNEGLFRHWFLHRHEIAQSAGQFYERESRRSSVNHTDYVDILIHEKTVEMIFSGQVSLRFK
jgi:hypothetical protein